MKIPEELSELFYQDQHISCSTYKGSLNTGFRYVELRSGHGINSKYMPRHNLIMLISGAINVSCNTYNNHTLRGWQMILIPKSARFEALATERAELVLFGFDLSTTGCDNNCLKRHSALCDRVNYDFKSTEIREPIRLFINLLVFYLRSGVNCPHIHESKHKELFLCLKDFYSAEEVAYLMHPIIKSSEGFRSTILENTSALTCINDMIGLTNMSRPRFFVKFKKEFGVTAKQWMLKHQIEKIKQVAGTPNITVKELMIEVGFDNSSQFCQFCKQHFGCTPTALLNDYLSVKQ